MAKHVDNILRTHSCATPQERERGMMWYVKARDEAIVLHPNEVVATAVVLLVEEVNAKFV